MYGNVFYFRQINKIGGTEQFLYEIAKKYRDWDITVFYDEADIEQVRRLRKFVRCIRRTPGEKVYCNKAFFNFNIDMIEDVVADDYIFVSHANYEELGYKPPIEHPKLTKFIGVSKFATRKLQEYMNKLGIEGKAECIYDPLMMEPKKDVKILVCACRLDDPVKGGARTVELIKALDKVSEELDENYLMLIFTNHTDFELPSKNAIYMEPRIDVRPFIGMASYVVQLSNDMETYGYTINEGLAYGVPIITTPLSVLKELPIDNNMRIELDWDCSNVEKVAREVFKKKVKPFKYTPPEAKWEKVMEKGKSTYKERKLKMVTLRFVGFPSFFCIEERKELKAGETIKVDEERAEVLMKTRCFERC